MPINQLPIILQKVFNASIKPQLKSWFGEKKSLTAWSLEWKMSLDRVDSSILDQELNILKDLLYFFKVSRVFNITLRYVIISKTAGVVT